MDHQKYGKTIQSVQRAIDIIGCFENLQTELTLAQISATLGLNKSTVHGIISTLYNNDYITQTPSGRYKLGAFFLQEYSNRGISVRTLLREKSLLGMNRVADKYNVSCALFILEMGDLVLVNRIQPINEAYTVTTYATYIQPLYCSASGKLLLADMGDSQLREYLAVNPLIPRTEKTICKQEALMEEIATVRSQGYGLENEELGQGIFSVAVPIYNEKKLLFATVSVSGLVFKVRPSLTEIIKDLKALSADISSQIFGID